MRTPMQPATRGRSLKRGPAAFRATYRRKPSRTAMSTATKLTLRLDAATVERAKRYARRRGTSVSQLVEAYFAALDAPAQQESTSLPPITARLSDRPPAPPMDEDDYHRHLEEKYR